MAVIVVKCKEEGERVLHALDIINSTEGRWFSCGFIKRSTGEERNGTFRTNVSKYVKGVGMAYVPKEHDLRGVWEAGNKEGDKAEDAYRMINLRGVFYLKVDGNEYHYQPKPVLDTKKAKVV